MYKGSFQLRRKQKGRCDGFNAEVSEAFRSMLAACEKDVEIYSLADRIAWILIQKAMRGNLRAMREILERTEGKPRRSVNADDQMEDPFLELTHAFKKGKCEIPPAR